MKSKMYPSKNGLSIFFYLTAILMNIGIVKSYSQNSDTLYFSQGTNTQTPLYYVDFSQTPTSYTQIGSSQNKMAYNAIGYYKGKLYGMYTHSEANSLSGYN